MIRDTPLCSVAGNIVHASEKLVKFFEDAFRQRRLEDRLHVRFQMFVITRAGQYDINTGLMPAKTIGSFRQCRRAAFAQYKLDQLISVYWLPRYSTLVDQIGNNCFEAVRLTQCPADGKHVKHADTVLTS